MSTTREQDAARKKALCARLARVEGQVRGLQRLIQADSEPEKVAQQMAAARKALDKSFYALISGLLADQRVTAEEAADLLLRFA